MFGDDETLQSKTTPQKEMYCVGDLAFYAMIRERRRFRTTRDREVRAIARARAAHRGTNADVIRQQESVKEMWQRNFKDDSDKVSVEIQRKAEREATRIAALEVFETQRCAAVFLRRWWTRTRLKRGCDGESCTVLALGESRG